MSDHVSPAEQLSAGEPSVGEAQAKDPVTPQAELSALQRTTEELRAALDEAHARERLMAYELQHRVRNMLAVIRSIYRRSRENGASQDEFAEHFEGRLNAVARYQSAITGHAGVDLEDMVRDELLDVHGLDGPQLEIAGPPLQLRGKSAELMGLAVHELTTNAIKFGALYHQGSLSITWSVIDRPTAGTLHFRWVEEGVRSLTPAPRPRGFGRELIEEALPYQLGATTLFEIKPAGVECSIILPVRAPNQSSAGLADADMPLSSIESE